MKRITDPTFKYRNAANTDIRETFRRERNRLKKVTEFNQHRVVSIGKVRRG